MHQNDFDYHLPPELIAHHPPACRSASRLLCLDRQTGKMQHKFVVDLPDLLEPGDLLVFNDTRVIPARLFARRTTGGRVEIMLERILDSSRALVRLRSSKTIQASEALSVDGGGTVIAGERAGEFQYIHLGEAAGPAEASGMLALFERCGHMPLPPYIQRPDEEADRERYQTIYAQRPGAVAAPTAGLHFDETLLQALRQRGVHFGFLTLHVGAGTYQPMRVEQIAQHRMHREWIDVGAALIAQIQQVSAAGGRIVPIGTTAVRALETVAQRAQSLLSAEYADSAEPADPASPLAVRAAMQPWQGETEIFIYPGYEFLATDALFTNFHLPRSTLLMLVCAFAGHARTLAAYRSAVEQGYRFFSYGDAMYMDGCPAGREAR